MKSAESDIRMQVAARIDVGRRRERQEDHFGLCVDLGADNWSFTADAVRQLPALGALLVVADGMGGQNAGEQASLAAVAAVRSFFAPCTGWSVPPVKPAELLKEAAIFAHREVVRQAAADARYEGMGTTLVMVWWLGNQAYLCWIGDSRCYLFRDGQLRCLTKDHSYVQHLIDTGALSIDEAEHFPHRNVIMQSLGQAALPSPDIGELSLQPDDLLLLCTDGLNGMLQDAQISDIMEAGHSPSQLAGRLVEAANAAGGHDNITVVLATWPAAASPADEPFASLPRLETVAPRAVMVPISPSPEGAPLAGNRRSGGQLSALLLLGLSLLAIGVLLSAIRFFSWQQEITTLPTAEKIQNGGGITDTIRTPASTPLKGGYVLQVNAFEQRINAEAERKELAGINGLNEARMLIFVDSSQQATRYYKLLITGFSRREEADSFRTYSEGLKHALVVPAFHFSVLQ